VAAKEIAMSSEYWRCTACGRNLRADEYGTIPRCHLCRFYFGNSTERGDVKQKLFVVRVIASSIVFTCVLGAGCAFLLFEQHWFGHLSPAMIVGSVIVLLILSVAAAAAVWTKEV
jgi:hypothetical protein